MWRDYYFLSIYDTKPWLWPVSALHGQAPGTSVPEVSCAFPLNIPHRNRGMGHQRMQDRWLGRSYDQTNRPAMSQSQKNGRPVHILRASAWNLDLQHSGKTRHFPEAASSQEHWGAWPRYALPQGHIQYTCLDTKTERRTAERLCPEKALSLTADVSLWAAFTAGSEKNSIKWHLFWQLHSLHKCYSPATITAASIVSSSFPLFI